MVDASLETLLAFAEELADSARPIVARYFRQPLTVDVKADDSPVTIADRSVEAALRARIAERFPDHAVYGEEMGHLVGPRTWVLDPIDGTKAFITGSPLFGTLIAFAEDGVPRLGVIDCPAAGDRWVGMATESRLNGAPARTSGCRAIAAARCYATSPDSFIGRDFDIFERISRMARLRRFGGDCHAYGLLASGHCDLVLDAGTQPYDYMALVPVIEGAGGVISDWSGAPLGFSSDGRIIAAASPELHKAVLAQIN